MTMDGEGPAADVAVLDIGGDTGAIQVMTDASLLGREVHVTLDGTRSFAHAVVHRRPVRGGADHSALFPELLAGSYRLLAGGAAGRRVDVIAGEVTIVDLREQSAAEGDSAGDTFPGFAVLA